MRLLVINPNTSAAVSALIRNEAQYCASENSEIVMRTASYGMEYIETRLEAAIAATAVAESIAREAGPVDGIVVAAFGDPGIPALKELVDVPVVGITEASLCAAGLLGQRFSIIAISQRIRSWYLDAVDRFGLTARLASLRALADDFDDLGSVQDDCREAFARMSLRAVREDGADVVVLAGAPLSGLARTLGDTIPVPVVDSVAAGVRMCEALAGLRCGVAREGAFALPPDKPRVGLSVEMDAFLERRRSHLLVEQDGDRES